MRNVPSSFNLDDEMKPGHSEKPILKEEQKKVLERLLEVDNKRLSPEELELMQQLISRLDEDSQRIKTMRRKVEGRGGLENILSALQRDPDVVKLNPMQPKPQETPKQEAPPPQSHPIEAPRPTRRASSPQIRPQTPPASQSQPSQPRMQRTTPSAPPSQTSSTPPPKPWSSVQGPSTDTPERQPAPSKPTPRKRLTPAPKPEAPQPTAPEPVESPELKKSDVVLEVSKPEKAGQDPVDVVRKYIVAWNHKAFGAEYDCFSISLMKMSKEEYVDRRMAAYLSYNRGGDFVQELETVLKTHVDGSQAEVVCVRTVREFHKLNRYTDFYALKLEGNQWRITGVTSEILKGNQPGNQSSRYQTPGNSQTE